MRSRLALVLAAVGALAPAHPVTARFAHLGIEMPQRDDVDQLADRVRAAGCLAWEPTDLPAPVGYVCAHTDLDGNVIEISHDQSVYAKVREKWGSHNEQ